MTDNFKLYKDYIDILGGLPDNNEKGNLDKYYVIELMRRGKDNPDMPAANYHFKNYYIYSWRDLDKYEEEIKNICDLLRLRAYASVNYKLMSQVSLDTLAESARRIAVHDYKKFYNIFESCSGKFVDHKNNVWIVDIDKDDLITENCNETLLTKLFKFINTLDSSYTDKVIYDMPTKNGVHIICHSFNIKQFNDNFNNWFGNMFKKIPGIKKNHLTLLYENL